MPHKARIDVFGAVYDIILQGAERTVIFRFDTDWEIFLPSSGPLQPESSTP